MIARALSLLGLMKRSEHERLKNEAINAYCRLNDSLRDERNSAQAELKRVAWDIAGYKSSIAEQADEIAALKAESDTRYDLLSSACAEIEALRPDALKWRNYLKRSRDRKAGKKGVANG